jgi:hypothetical protein
MSDFINQFGNINSTNIDVSGIQFFLNLMLCGLFSHLLSFIYQKYGDSLSNRTIFSRNFVPLSLTTAIIITVVKSSLALSLGLVGALSIIRFRSAIKEPEELLYLFMTIALGLGFGANQGVITVIGILIIISFIIFRKINSSNSFENQTMHLIISHNKNSDINMDGIITTIKNHATKVGLQRYEKSGDTTEVSLSLEVNDFENFSKMKNQLFKIDESIHFTFLDEIN